MYAIRSYYDFLNKNFYLGTNFGYSIDTRNRLKYPMESFKISELLDFRSVDNALNWSGLRIGFTVAAIFNKVSKKNKTQEVNKVVSK